MIDRGLGDGRVGRGARGDSGAGAERVLLALIGSLMLILGTVVLVDYYTDDYDCIYDVRCSSGGGSDPTTVDRTRISLGFGLEQPGAPEDVVPGPWATVLLIGGVAVLLAALAWSPSQAPTVEVNLGAGSMDGLDLRRTERQFERRPLGNGQLEEPSVRSLHPYSGDGGS